ncbi:hypothetical protein SLE2022_175600 [Rubroshorea leprosula]
MPYELNFTETKKKRSLFLSTSASHWPWELSKYSILMEWKAMHPMPLQQTNNQRSRFMILMIVPIRGKMHVRKHW